MNQETKQSRSLSELRPQATQRYSVSLTDSQGFELAQRAANLLASSGLVPEAYRGSIPNCVIALNMAQRIGADPLQVMQNLVVVHGNPTWSAQFLIATVNACGRFSALRYEFFGERNDDSWGCRAWAIEKETGEKLIGTDVTIAMAKAEGWYDKKGSKWKTMPQQMLMYRSGAWWARAYAPELSMGLQTNDEAIDILDIAKDGTVSGVTTEKLRNPPREIKLVEIVQEEPTAPAQELTSAVNQETGEITQAAMLEPSPEELARIDAREMAEASDQQPAPAPRTRRVPPGIFE